MNERPRITSRGIVVHDGKILLMERWRDSLHYFSIPGGEVEPGETIEEAAVRELHEEMSITVSLLRKVYVMTSPDSEHHIYLCGYNGGEPKLHPESPEALANPLGYNRFAPCWVDIKKVAELPFMYWEPLRLQIAHDLQNGFADDCKTIVVTNV